MRCDICGNITLYPHHHEESCDNYAETKFPEGSIHG